MNNLQLNSEQNSALQESLAISETSFNLLSLNCNSVENIPILNAQVAFQVDSSAVFREQGDIVPTIVDDRTAEIQFIIKY